MNVFFEKIFKSFPDRQNFKIFLQRACKHLQNTKKYVIINKLISITIKNGLMVKRLRRCPLTAESAVRFRMGLPKKNDIQGMSFFFWYTPKRKRRGNLFAVVRQFAQANSCRRLPSPALLLSRQLHMGNGNFRMGLHTSSVRGTTRQLVCRRSSICASKFCRSSPFYGSRENPKGHANGNGNFRMGLHTSSVRETTRQLVCRRSYLRQQILP